ncbi:MAG: hypothetical protein CV081_09390 [Nitrospira sp. LK265]|nr:hypothetical protein [Nitrospira sp. LK265]
MNAITMRRMFSIIGQYFALIILAIMGLLSFGCGDSASVLQGPDVPLASLTISPGTLQPAFSSNTVTYGANVSPAVGAVTVTATPQDSTATVTIAGTATQSLTVTLGAPGSSKDITIIVTSTNGSQSTYTITVHKAALSGNTDLSALTVSPGTLVPAFAPGTMNYTVDVGMDVASVTVSATKDDPSAVLSGSITNPGPGQATGRATIQLGAQGSATPVSIIVIAPNGNSDTYRIVVNRAAPSSDNKLSALTVSAGTLVPAFSPDTENYTVGVAAANGTVTISATKSDPNAVMALGSVIVGAGTPTGQTSVQLGPGASLPVNIIVTAQDQISIKQYTVTVSRPLS